MGAADSVMLLSICGLLLLVVIGPFVALWGYRRWSVRGASEVIAIDGASFLVMENGSITIQPRRVLYALIVGVFILFEFGLVLLFVTILSSGNLLRDAGQLLSLIAVFCFLGAVIRVAIPTLFRHSVHINKFMRRVEIDGKVQQLIPFSNVEHVWVGSGSGAVIPSITAGPGTKVESVAFGLRLKDDSSLLLGGLSDAPKLLRVQAVNITHMIARVVSTGKAETVMVKDMQGNIL